MGAFTTIIELKEIMKIGIITFWQTEDNYGQVLQCWALQTYLRSIGHDAYLIRYTHLNPLPIRKEQIKKALKIYPIFRKVYKKILGSNPVPTVISTPRGFEDFKMKHIIQSPAIYHNLTELQANPPKADCYIVGSDQVWAQLLDNKNNEVFYLNFGSKNVRRISYAASFAMGEYPQQLLKRFSKQLARFQAISVREKSGIDICAKAGAKAQLVIDPTLLLEAKLYMPFIKEQTFHNYVFFYILNISSSTSIYYDKLKEYFNSYKFVYTTASGFNQINFDLPGGEHVHPNIEEWLSLIFYSKLVITTSFHGVAICVKLNKPFLFFPLTGKYAASNNRVVDLLKELGLSDRIMYDINSLDKTVNATIDWSEVNTKLQLLSSDSKRFLDNNL